MLNETLIALTLMVTGGLASLAFLAKLSGRGILVLGAILVFLGVPVGLGVYAVLQGTLTLPWDGRGMLWGIGLALGWFFFQVLREALA